MIDRKLTPELADEIYTVLASTCGAPDEVRTTKSGVEYNPSREDFVREFSEKDNPTREWRFCGKLGFGGKFWHNNDKFYVSCYQEDETKEIEAMICTANQELSQIYTREFNK